MSLPGWLYGIGVEDVHLERNALDPHRLSHCDPLRLLEYRSTAACSGDFWSRSAALDPTGSFELSGCRFWLSLQGAPYQVGPVELLLELGRRIQAIT